MSQATRHPVKGFTASEALEQYRLVKRTAGSGTAVSYCGAEDEPIGVTDQDDIASGEHVSVRLLNDVGSAKLTAAGAIQVGDSVVPAASGKIDDAIESASKALGVALEAATADGDIIEVLLYGAMPDQEGLIYAAVADSASVTNTVAETAFDKAKTIKGADLRVGDVLEVIARAFCVATNSTDTLALKLYLGTEEIVTTGAVDVANSDIGFVHAFIVIRTTGASGTISASGTVALGGAGTVTAKPWRKDQATEDISGDVELVVKATWSVANAGNDVILEDFIVIHHRR